VPTSGSRSFQGTFLRWTAILCLVEVFAVFIFLPPRIIKGLIDSERTIYARDLGADAEDAIRGKADRLFKSLAIDTGFRDATFQFFSGQFSDGDKRSPVDDRGLGAWEERQIKASWGAFYLALYRWSAIIAWVPFVLPVGLASIFDGLVRWRVGQWRFSFSSPVRHGTALHLIAFLVLIAFCVPILPVPMTPFLAPALLFVAAGAAWITTSNLPKRF